MNDDKDKREAYFKACRDRGAAWQAYNDALQGVRDLVTGDTPFHAVPDLDQLDAAVKTLRLAWNAATAADAAAIDADPGRTYPPLTMPDLRDTWGR